MQAESASIAAGIGYTEQGVAGEGKNAALCGIGGVGSDVLWNQDVVRVVSAVEEEADQALRVIITTGRDTLGGQGGIEKAECS